MTNRRHPPVPSRSRARYRAVVNGKDHSADATLDYLREAYASTRDWYVRAETKAQILLATNGAFIAVLFTGLLPARVATTRPLLAYFGLETWLATVLATMAIMLAVGCATATMWSLHGRPTQADFTEMGVDPSDGSTYKPEVLWYFGHLARLDLTKVGERLRVADKQFAIAVLSYHLPHLSGRVLRKYWYLNLGWLWTAIAFILVSCAGISLLVRVSLNP
jgi:hypothetical protein